MLQKSLSSGAIGVAGVDLEGMTSLLNDTWQDKHIAAGFSAIARLLAKSKTGFLCVLNCSMLAFALMKSCCGVVASGVLANMVARLHQSSARHLFLLLHPLPYDTCVIRTEM